jgi:hypothetical protein
MAMCKVAKCVIALLMMTAGFAVPVRAGPISGSFGGDSILAPTGTPGIFVQKYTGTGNDTTFGAFTVESTSTADFSHPPDIVVSNGSFTETFTEGELFGTSSGDGTASGTGTATATIDIVFTGGTGLFAGAAGEATSLQTLMSTGPTTTSGTGTYSGSLAIVVEPSSLALLAPAVFVLCRRRRRMIVNPRKPQLN